MLKFQENNFEKEYYFEIPKIEVKCLNCSRIIEIKKNTIMVLCLCGEMFDLLNIEVEQNG